MANAPEYAVPANVEEVLQNTARKYRQELITMPTKGLRSSLQYMTLRPGIRVSETVGELVGDAEFGPYRETETNSNMELKSRTLEVFLGNVAQKFSPNSVYSTIWGANTMMGEGLKGVPIALQVLSLIALRLGANLNKVLFSAVRNAAGDKSKDLFNGFDTIAKNEKDAGNISAEKGNLLDLSSILSDGGVDDDNAIDVAQAICESADENLMDSECFLFVPRKFVNLYNRAYLKRFGSVPYNTKYNKTTVEGFDNVSFAPLSNKADSAFFQLTTKSNMLVGVNESNNSDAETVNIGKYSSWVLTYEAVKLFGCQYESINKERILFVTKDGTTPLIS